MALLTLLAPAFVVLFALGEARPVPSAGGPVPSLEERVYDAERRGDLAGIGFYAEALAARCLESRDIRAALDWLQHAEGAAWRRVDLRGVVHSRVARAALRAGADDAAGLAADVEGLPDGWLALAAPATRVRGHLLRARAAAEAGRSEDAAVERRSALAACESAEPQATADRCLEVADHARRAGDAALREDAIQRASSALAGLHDPGRLAKVLSHQGLSLQDASRYREALSVYKEALDAGPDPFDEMQILGGLAAIKETLGEDLEGALRDLRTSQALAAAIGYQENAGPYATLESNLLAKRGDPVGALAAARRAVAWNERLQNPRYLVESLAALASCLEQAGLADELRSTARRLLEVADGLQHDPYRAFAHYRLSGVSDPPENLEHLEQSLEFARRANHAESLAAALGARAWLHYEAGRPAEALVDAAESAELYDQLCQEPQALEVLDTVVRCHLANGDWSRAEREIAGVLRRLENSTLGMGSRPAPTHLSVAFAYFEPLAQDLVALRVRLGADAEAARRDGFRRAGLFRSRSLLAALLGRRDSNPSESDASLEEECTLAGQRLRAAAAALSAARGQDVDAIERLRGELLAARRQHELASALLVDGVRRRLRTYDPFLTTPEQARRLLPDPARALVVYAEGISDVYAYGLREGRLAFVPLGPKDAIANPVSRVRRALAGARPELQVANPIASRRELDDTLAEIHQRILAPVLAELGAGVEEILIVPSPLVNGLPFEALVVERAPVQKSGRTSAAEAPTRERPVYLVERCATAYLPSVPTGIQLSRAARDASRLHPGLVMGDPAFVSVVPAGAERGSREPYRRLPSSRDEAVDVADRLEDGIGNERDPQSAERFRRIRRELGDDPDGPWKSDRVELLVGAKATRSAFLERAPAARLLHVATHGAFEPGDPDSTGLVFAPDAEGSSIVSLNDLLGLRLQARLAVLAACDTAVGDAETAEGPLSIAWAFLHAGALGVVGSRWRARDDLSHQVMVAFYEHLLRDRDNPAVALRRAKLELLRAEERGLGSGTLGPLELESSEGHPWFWAPFAYFGLPE